MTQMVKLPEGPPVVRPASPAPFALAMVPKDLPQLMRFCELLGSSSICPKSLKGDPMALMVAIQAGEKHGMDVLGSIQNIAIINGKPSFYGDAMLGICRKSNLFGGIRETGGGSMDTQDAWAECKVWRRGEDEHPTVQRFTYAMAKRAGLLGKAGPWKDYPERMLMFRARGFALRDCFPDLLSGIISAEEAMDYPTVDHQGNAAPAVTGPVRDAQPLKSEPDVNALDRVEALLHKAQSWSQFAEADAALKAAEMERGSEIHTYMLGVYRKAQQRILEAQLTTCRTPAEWVSASRAYSVAPQEMREDLLAQFNAAQARAETDEEDEQWQRQTQDEDDVPY